MKVFKSAWNTKPHGAPQRPPLRTFSEVAEALGVTPNELRMAMSRHPGAPKPAINGQQHSAAKNNYYRLDQFRAWWKTVASTSNV
jgi:hypothetical protein